ncbi:hypothetical protein FHG64_06360 [Antarcticibacterium flavum]|uniref:Helicase n=1 Tax=Antarcticibacterium flavum TaxID=2058175 RepID=A0A5B7X347_9FLAO|nr:MULTISPECIES: SNF2-related protein [Antarcticibacterium]MCM4161270.1 hypothetical protein [Antarcticibacterium sp. W02-3]QCY69058.1 hypothetical protein FHG64_06360 [Antarcticibacterium flavum]
MSKAPNINLDTQQFFLDFDSLPDPYLCWPNQEDFPINLPYPPRTVESVLLNDLSKSRSFIILTGYTSLSYLIDQFGKTDNLTEGKTIKVVLGFDPNFRGRKRYHVRPLDKEIKEYWLLKGLSILQGGSVISLISKIDKEIIKFKFFNKLHAKIYVGDSTAMIGSANFSQNGLTKQTEANLRVMIDEEKNKYDAIKTIAENYYIKANNYNELVDLLQTLIGQVDWRDALARAISEILDGGWLSEYKNLMAKLGNTKLWPTQWRGLAQAMTILQENSNVLIADPTGAGKTKLCSTIILALESWLYETGNREKANSIIVCPPLVMDKWRQEFQELSTISNNQISNGTLSNGRLKKLKIAESELKLANILAIDEAHNYLNINSKRSIAIRRNNADFKILITATPINKKLDDLLKIVELLDLDNLDDESFESFKNLKLRPDLKNPRDTEILKQFVSKFTVRRTKKSINEQIAKEPALYENALGNTCRFPTQIAKTYRTLETEKDKEIVEQINNLCLRIKGITYLKQTKKPKFKLKEEERQSYIERRLTASKFLSIYVIRHRLRSSRVALLEHIIGMEELQKWERFDCIKVAQNKIKLDEIDKLISKNRLPYIHKDFKECEWPKWMVDKNEYKKACQEERELYSRIAALVKKLSPARENGKAKELIRQLKDHEKILAFDNCVITLHYLKYKILGIKPSAKILLATGDTGKESDEVLEKFKLTSKNSQEIIALCSDKMSEGVDLQKASAVTLLDLPSVIRIVEQRFGRIDRMDTPFKEIEMYWPDDSTEFSLKGDKRLFELTDLVHDTIGSNFEVPDNLKFKHFSETEDIKHIIKEYEAYELADDSWEGINDSFQPILDLKQGDNPLISEEEYNSYKNVKASVKTGVSFLKSDKKWCFIAVRGDKAKSPKWYFIDAENKQTVFTEFQEICGLLRQHIGTKQVKVEWNDDYLEYYLNILRKKEFDLLAPKKRRALDVARHILSHKITPRNIDKYEKGIIKQLLKLFNEENKFVNLDEFASTWIKILQPYLDDKRNKSRNSRHVYNLNNLKSTAEVKRINFDKEQLQEIFENAPQYEEIDHKIASCIVGVPVKGNDICKAI